VLLLLLVVLGCVCVCARCNVCVLGDDDDEGGFDDAAAAAAAGVDEEELLVPTLIYCLYSWLAGCLLWGAWTAARDRAGQDRSEGHSVMCVVQVCMLLRLMTIGAGIQEDKEKSKGAGWGKGAAAARSSK